MFTLKNILKANAASCIIFGLLFVLAPTEIVMYLGGDNPMPELFLLTLGAVLMVNGVHLTWAAFQDEPNKFLILYFSFGDFLWMIGTVVLITTSLWITTLAGIIASVFIAIMVTIFGVLQIIKRREMCNL